MQTIFNLLRFKNVVYHIYLHAKKVPLLTANVHYKNSIFILQLACLDINTMSYFSITINNVSIVCLHLSLYTYTYKLIDRCKYLIIIA